MNNSLLRPASCKAVVRVFFILLFPLFSYSQTFIGVSSTPADNAAQAGPTATIVPPGNMQTGDLVVVYAQYRSGNTDPTLSIAATGGQSWVSETVDNGLANQTIRIFWCRFNGTWTAPNPSVQVSTGTAALSASMYVYRPTSPSNFWAIHAGPAHSTTSTTTNTITPGYNTTVDNTVTMAFWANTSNTPTAWTGPNGTTDWKKPTLTTPPPAQYQFRNTLGTTNRQSHTAAYNIQADAAALEAVSQVQATATATRRSIITWMETPPPPANDLCANAIALTSSFSCVNTTGTLDGATYTAISTLGCGTAGNDVWYSFVAKTTNPTITLTSSLANPRIQLFSACNTAVANACSTTGTLATSGLTVGNTYRIRVYTDPNVSGTFDICVTDPRPANDECNGAIQLTPNTTCTSPIATNVYGASASAIPIAPCTGPVTYDLWYYFKAPVNNATITLSSIGASIGAANLNTQLFSGDCAGELTSIA
ncbi:MAG TPA: hypothetical protein VD794_05120, partial [Flavisolibacter sp.]|nr:hypothetical protein [Flavisolibacter sp.]